MQTSRLRSIGFWSLLAACGGGGAGALGDAGVTDATGSSDAGKTDAPIVADASSDATDAGADAQPACPPAGDTTSCADESECSVGFGGCYCGEQPAFGVSKSRAAEVGACQAKAAADCQLGCPNMPGYQPQEGGVVDAATQVGVRCDKSSGASGTCVTFAM